MNKSCEEIGRLHSWKEATTAEIMVIGPPYIMPPRKIRCVLCGITIEIDEINDRKLFERVIG